MEEGSTTKAMKSMAPTNAGQEGRAATNAAQGEARQSRREMKRQALDVVVVDVAVNVVVLWLQVDCMHCGRS